MYSDASIVDASGFNSRIGYDAVVCVEMFEPWVLEIYNSTLGVPTTTRISSKTAGTDFELNFVGNKGSRYGWYPRSLNSTGKAAAYHARYIASNFH